MRLAEALKINQNSDSEGDAFEVLLATGSVPLHLKTFLQAYLQQALNDRRVIVREGLYGDLAGTIERAQDASSLQGIAVVLEWSDLDSRLGFRSTAPWSLEGMDDIVACASASLARFSALLRRVQKHTRIVLSLPTLPFPPLFHTSGPQASEPELRLASLVASFAADASGPGLAVLNPRRVEEESPAAGRFDLKTELLIGFPYSMAHAEVLARTCAEVLKPATPKKGIITDLDDTLWSGLVGEVGPAEVSWSFAEHHHLHGLYQNLLNSLAGEGVLIAVASKNDPAAVEKTFERSDLLLDARRVFPFEVHWAAKSGSVSRILQTWNVGADSVIFVDDSPLELAEVAAQHPGIECLLFPKGDYPAVFALLRKIRDLCGKDHISVEDRIRQESIRQGVEFRELPGNGETADRFLEKAQAVVTFDFAPADDDRRVLELVNKTNQFNLNGSRRTEADWRSQNDGEGSVAAVIGYEDKFGPLGKIAVFQGHRSGKTLQIETWVMSCRAFSRRVEYQCIQTMFTRFRVAEIRFAFAPTPKNAPMRDFLTTILGTQPTGPVTLGRTEFGAVCPALFHQVVGGE